MTKKDYILIAQVINKTKPKEENYRSPVEYGIRQYHFDRLCFLFADALEAENEKFDRDKFLKACVE